MEPEACSGQHFTQLFVLELRSGTSTRQGNWVRSVVLLKHGTLEIIECPSDAIFELARFRSSGICGSFPNHEDAKAFVKRILSEDYDRISLTGSGLPTLAAGT
jgi:hypothetical protein